MEKLLYWCAGADLVLINHASPQDRGRYAMLGVLILFTATLSGISMFFMARYLTQDPVLCGFIALFWSSFIFSIDRYLSISITSYKAHVQPNDRPEKNHSPVLTTSSFHQPADEATSGYLFAVLSRLTAAIFLSVVISIPVKLALFEKDINGFLANQNRNERSHYFSEDVELQALKDERETIHETLAGLSYAVQHAEQRATDRYHDMKNELDGRGSSGKPGFGPYFEQAKAAYEEAKNQLQHTREQQSPEVERLRTRDAEIVSLINKRLIDRQEKTEVDNGLLRRYHALSTLADQRNEVSISLWLISALFVFIEAFPLLTKASSRRDSYEKLLVKLALQHQHEALEDPRRHAVSTPLTADSANTAATLIPNQYRSYLILLGVAQCVLFPFVYRYVQGYTDSFTPTLILYMFSPISILLAFLITELLALRPRTLWQSLRPDEDLNFSLQALAVLLTPVSVILYLLFQPEATLLEHTGFLTINRQPLFDHSNFWVGWAIVVLTILYFSHRSNVTENASHAQKKSQARHRQIQELENRLAQGRQAYRNGCASLYGLAAGCALCSFVLCVNLPTTLDREIFWIMQLALMSVPVIAVLLASSGLRIPITTVLSIANSRSKQVYTLLVIFASITATGMCLLLVLSQFRLPPEPNQYDSTVMNEASTPQHAQARPASG